MCLQVFQAHRCPNCGCSTVKVWINQDTDRLDVTLVADSSTTPAATATEAEPSKAQQVAVASHGTRAPPTAQGQGQASQQITPLAETIHTTVKHP